MSWILNFNETAVVTFVALGLLWNVEFTTEEIELLSNHTFDEVSEKEAVDNQDSSVHTEFTNINSNNVKLILKWSSFIWLFTNSRENLTFAGHISDNAAKEPSLTGLDLGTREKYWGWNIMMTFGELGISFMINLS